MVSHGTIAQVSLDLGDASLAPGAGGAITTTLSTDGSAVALQFDVVYDPAVVTLGTVNPGPALTPNHSLASNPIASGRDRIVITTSPVTALGGGLLATINLTALGAAAPGPSDVRFEGVVISDNAANPITPSALTPGVITILGGAGSPSPAPAPTPAPEPEPIPALPAWALLLLAGLLGLVAARARATRVASIAALALLGLSAPSEVYAQRIPGDANGDGRIDVEDVRLIVERILQRGVLPGDGDCNRDNTINVLDTVCSQIPFVPGETAPIILGPGDRSIAADIAFEMRLFAADPDERSTQDWSLVRGPAGLVVATDGRLTWTPPASAAGANAVRIRVVDDTGRSAEADFAITVFVLPPVPASNAAPVLSVPDDLVLPIGTPIAAQASATDADTGDTLTYGLINGPVGMSINPSTGALTWTPGVNQPGRADVVIEVTDAAGATDVGSFIVDATAANAGPQAVDDVYIARKGETLVIPAPEGVIQNDTDPNDDGLEATRLSDPTRGTLDSFGTDGRFSYTPSAPPGITIGMQEECSAQDAAADLSGAVSAGDVDNDGEIELVALRRKSTAETDVMIIDPVDCSFTLTPVLDRGIPDFHGLTTLVNLDDDPELELVKAYSAFQADIVADEGGTGIDNRLMATNIDGSPLSAWLTNHSVGGLSAEPTTFEDNFQFDASANSPVAADLDGDGNVELLLGYNSATEFSDGLPSKVALVAWDGRSGNVRWEFVGDQVRGSNRGIWPTLVDLDLDGDTEIIFNHHVLDHEGNLLFDLPHDPVQGVLFDTLTTAIANFDNDAFPEIIAYDEDAITLYAHDGQIQWRVERRLWNFGFPFGGITIAELDGDPLPEFVFTGNAGAGTSAVSLFAFDDNGDVLWGQAERGFAVAGNGSQASTPVAFDLDGDGVDELIQQKGAHDSDPFFSDGRPVEAAQPSGLYIFDGATGDVIDVRPFEASLESQHPLTVADVDGDGSAEIIATPVDGLGGLGSMLVQKIGHIPGNPWPAVRTTRFQTAMEPTYRNADGSVPSTLEPHWLQPGRNAWNRVVPDRDPFEPETDSFTYRVSDGAVDSNTATVNIELRPAGNPPFFLSEPVTGTSRGVTYVYDPFTVDVDPGDVVTFELVNGPSGMTIDPATGALRWYSEVAGDYPVSILATDTLGLSSAQIFTVSVGDPVIVPDVVGSTEGAAESTLASANLSKGAVFVASSTTIATGQVLSQAPPAGSAAEFGSAVALTLSLGPAPLDRDDDSDGFSENEGDCNDDATSIFPGAPDGNDDGIDQDCDGLDGTKTLVAIEISPGAKRVLTGEPTPLIATGIFDDGTAQNLTAIATWTNGPTFASGSAGSFQAQAEFRGITGSADFTVLDRVVEELAPIARIDTPAGGDVVTAPTDIEGLVSDTNLLRWELAYRYAGEDDFVLFREGFLAENQLGEFDPTTLINGLYDLRLRAFDTAGNVSEDSTTVLIERQIQVGNFTQSFTDVDVPMAGVPIRVTRTYDSRDKRQGDFGIGWTLDIKSVRLQASRVLGSGWRVLRSGLSFALVPTDVHIVSLVFPDGREEQFDMVVTPSASPIVPFPPFTQSVRFEGRGRTLGRLESLDDNNISILDAQPGPIALRRDNDGSVYDPTLFRYTSADGTQVVIDRQAGVRSITDPNGNTLTIDDNGITHSAGKAIRFARDDAGRITRITDPAGNTQDYRYDANGDLRAHVDEDDNTTRFDYNGAHGLIRVTDPLNRLLTRNEYDDNGRLIRIVNSDGRTLEFGRQIGDRQEVITDVDGSVTVLEYDDRGNVVKVTDALGNTTINTYDAEGNQLSTTNALGETTTRTFDARDNLLTETDPLGATTTYTYDARDKVTSMTDALGRVTRYTYDARGNRLTTTDALGNVATNTYDLLGNLVAQADALGQTTRYAYDAFGNRTRLTDPRGNTLTVGYDANGTPVTEVDRRGAATAFGVNGRSLATTETDALNQTTTYDRDATGMLNAVIDPAGNVNRQDIDARGKDVAFIDALGERTEKRYDLKGNLVAVEDPLNRTTAYAYDILERLAGTTLPDGAQSVTRYDGVGRIVEEEDALGNVTALDYDAAGRTTRITDALGNVTQYTYDAVGNRTSMTNARGQVFTYAYDAMNRRIRVTYPDGTVSETAYDGNGQVIGETDALGRRTSYAYDANGNLILVTDPLGGESRFEYDADDNLIAQIDANGNTTRLRYDALGRRIAKTYPDGSTRTQTYDAAGNLATQTDPNGATTVFTYDANNRLLRKVFGDASEETYTYDAAGQLITATNAAGTVSYAYDATGRLSGLDNPDGSRITYAYDGAGNRISDTIQTATTPPRTTTYTYDALNRIDTVTDPEGQVTTHRYDAVGNLASIAYPNGVTTTHAYDVNNRLIEIRHANGSDTLEHYRYTVDAVGDRREVRNVRDGSRIEYAYDDRRRLIRESHFDGSNAKVFELRYAYDAVGNRRQTTDLAGNTTDYRYDTADKLLSAGDTNYAYDANGNVSALRRPGGETVLRFDAEDQLVGVSSPDAAISYTYDAQGERTGRGDGTNTVSYLVDPVSTTGFSQVLADYDASGLRAQSLFANQLLSREDAGQTRFYHQDASRNLRLLSDEAGQATDRYRYAAFGEEIGRSGATANPYTFASERGDEDAGLIYLRDRNYQPTTGRFLRRDPFEGSLGDPLSLHRYLYANANPVAFIDPSGQSATPTLVSVVAGLTIVAIVATVDLNIVLPKAREKACDLNAIGQYVGAVRDIDGPSLEIKREWGTSAGQWQKASVNEYVYLNDELRTDASTTAVIAFAVGGRAGIGTNGWVVVANPKETRTLENATLRPNINAINSLLDARERSFKIECAGGVVGVEG